MIGSLCYDCSNATQTTRPHKPLNLNPELTAAAAAALMTGCDASQPALQRGDTNCVSVGSVSDSAELDLSSSSKTLGGCREGPKRGQQKHRQVIRTST